MSIYQHSIRDERIREYVPVSRILLQEKISGAGEWIGSGSIQPMFSDSITGARLESGGSVLLDFGIELHGGIRIVNLGKEGRVRIRFGESVSEACGTPNQCHAIHDTEVAVPEFGMLEYGNTAFRFVRIDNAGGELFLLNVIAVALYRDLEYAGSFESSDERLNRIWKTAAYTLQLNMQDYIYDGAKRDRLVWMGDLHPEIRGILAAFRDVSLIRKSLDFLTSTTPLPLPMNTIRTYSCWWVIALADYYQATGDLEYIRAQKEYLLGLLELYGTYLSADGSECIPERRFLDWPSDEDLPAKHAGLQGLLYWMFRSGETLLRALDCDVTTVLSVQKRLKGRIPDCGENKAAAEIQTVGGLADRSDVLLRNPLHGISTFYGFYMLLAQPTRPALELIRRYWGAMMDRGATTFWEDFNLDWLENSGRIDEFTPKGKRDLHADFGAYCYKGLRHSLCHGWSCGPMPFLSERVLGIRFLEPGGRKILVKPDPAGLEYVSGTYPTPFGSVSVTCEGHGRIRIEAPSAIEVLQ